MKVIRKEDKNSSKYIIGFDVEKGVIQKNKRKNVTAIEITTEKFDNLVVSMADGAKPRYLNIKENKEKTLRRMWGQQKENKMEIDRLKKEITSSKVIFGISTILVILSSLYNPNIGTSILDYLALTISVVSTTSALCLLPMIKTKQTLKEILKNEYLKENEEELNKVDLDNPNMLLNVKTKQIEEIRKVKEKQERLESENIFDINSIGNLSLETLRQIKSNIERDNYLGLSTSSEETKENGGKQYKKV